MKATAIRLWQGLNKSQVECSMEQEENEISDLGEKSILNEYWNSRQKALTIKSG